MRVGLSIMPKNTLPNPSAATAPPSEPLAQFSLDVNKVPMLNPFNIGPVYANNAAVMQLPHDFRLIFSEIISDGPANPPRVEMRASVALSPTMLKATLEALTRTLENYETNFGEIKWPLQQLKTN
jgi:hypothetical protein